MKRRLAVLTLAATAVVVGAFPPLASADRVYHSEHLSLAPVGSAPLCSGFVESVKADGPTVYAHEIFVLGGALPDSYCQAETPLSRGRAVGRTSASARRADEVN
jgi:hypothetical protein